jgi:hypothetical protein
MINVDLVGGPETTCSIAAMISSRDLFVRGMAYSVFHQISPNGNTPLSRMINTSIPNAVELIARIMYTILNLFYASKHIKDKLVQSIVAGSFVTLY